MTDRTDTSSVIRDPFTLLYWLVFRGLALRRYAQSIHTKLDEDLNVWEVRGEAGNDPRFCVLCRARWGLMVSAPFCAVLLVSALSTLFGEDGNYSFHVPLIAHWIRTQRRLPRL